MSGGEKPELRLGLVLYGGVSLAVYIYGVVVEVQRLLRASDALENPSLSNDKTSAAYGDALHKGGLSRASVDIISGTSAGGINGILLAKALAAGGDVEEVGDLWVKGGDIGGLLRSLSEDEPESLLSTEVMEERLAEGFAKLGGGEWPASPGALDLFVSATHLRGDARRFHDSLGSEIDSLKHRYVFQLKLRSRYGRDDFERRPGAPPEVSSDAHLVKLARATSAFPVAFEPVELSRLDGLLGAQDEENAWFADGGILNNKPFTEALKTIFSRTADRPVRRWLLSVDPDPKPLERPSAPGPKPGFDQVGVDAVAKIPRYQSIATDLEALEDHNRAARQVSAMVGDLEWGLSEVEGGDGAAAASYRRLRLSAWVDTIADRLMAGAQPAVPGRFEPAAVHRGFREGVHAALSASGWESGDWMALPDLAFEMRRAYYLIKLIAMAAETIEEGADEVNRVAPAKAGIWDAFDICDDALWRSFSRLGVKFDVGSPAALAGQAREAGQEQTSGALEELSEARIAVTEAIEAAVVGVVALIPRPAPEEGEPPAFAVRLEHVFADFRRRDEFMLPIEAGGGLRHRDVVEHAQISPATATATGIAAGQKLAGDTAGHFGGFLDVGWRKNDLLWGRLDAAEILIDAILAESPGARGELTSEVHREILEAEGHSAPVDDPYAYLVANQLGSATMADLPASRMAGLKARAAFVLRAMIRQTARVAEHDPAVPPENLRRRALVAVDGALRTAGRIAFPYVRWLRRRARRSE